MFVYIYSIYIYIYITQVYIYTALDLDTDMDMWIWIWDGRYLSPCPLDGQNVPRGVGDGATCPKNAQKGMSLGHVTCGRAEIPRAEQKKSLQRCCGEGPKVPELIAKPQMEGLPSLKRT